MRTRRYLAADPTVCAVSQELVDGRIRTSDDPCGYYCSRPDFRGWKKGARFQVERALTRTDLPADVLATLRSYASELDASSETFRIAHATRRMARIHQAAQCAALWDPGNISPILPTVDEITETTSDIPSITRTIENVAMLAAAAYILSKVMK